MEPSPFASLVIFTLFWPSGGGHVIGSYLLHQELVGGDDKCFTSVISKTISENSLQQCQLTKTFFFVFHVVDKLIREEHYLCNVCLYVMSPTFTMARNQSQ